MAGVDRKTALCNQTRLTGIDFIQVVDPAAQDRLRVFFAVEPSALDVPMVDPLALVPPVPPAEAGPPVPAPGLVVSIVSQETGRSVEIVNVAWRVIAAPAGNRLALEISVERSGDFSIHRLKIGSALVDPFFNGVSFTFKQGCPSLFDCRNGCTPVPTESVDYPVIIWPAISGRCAAPCWISPLRVIRCGRSHLRRTRR
jgi:hypothetical protein